MYFRKGKTIITIGLPLTKKTHFCETKKAFSLFFGKLQAVAAAATTHIFTPFVLVVVKNRPQRIVTPQLGKAASLHRLLDSSAAI